jgi:hypothetical protein
MFILTGVQDAVILNGHLPEAGLYVLAYTSPYTMLSRAGWDGTLRDAGGTGDWI